MNKGLENFNPQMLEIARESRKQRQSDLAKSLEISQGYLSKIEKKLATPDSHLLSKIAQTLDYPVSFFFLQERKKDAHLDFFRKQKTISTLEISYIKAHINIYRLHAEILVKDIDFNVERIPQYEVSPVNSPADIANNLRGFWSIPNGPINNLTALLEEHGFIIIFSNIVDTVKFSGCSFFSRNYHPVIILNRNMSGDRIRFTLAHELGHLLMHKDEILENERNIEKEANDFASELLLPTEEVREKLRKIDLNTLRRMKYYWKVSMAAILEKAKYLNTITADQYKYMRMKFSKNGWNVEEPDPIEREEPALLNSIFNLYKSELGYSDEDLATLLFLNMNDYTNLFNNRPSLRLLK